MCANDAADEQAIAYALSNTRYVSALLWKWLSLGVVP